MPNPGPLSVGELLLGRFQILRFIAHGGMGVVYEARDEVLGARIALKVIREDRLQDTVSLERFRREVLLARRVSHPNVCRVHEFFDATNVAGTPVRFLTMEFLEGETLAERIQRSGSLNTAEALPLVRQICAGLEALDSVGIVHRDLKSSNILLVADRAQHPDATRAVITDFGLARGTPLGETGETDAGQPPLSEALPFVGTPAYMAPEQLTGGPLTISSDIYSLGVVMFEMVIGALPFSGPNPLALALRRIQEPAPRPELARPGLDRRWAETIRRCLQVDPRARFRRPSEIPSALESAALRPVWVRFLPLTLLLFLVGGLLLVRTVGQTKVNPGAESAAGIRSDPRNLSLHPRPLIAVDAIASRGPAELTWVGAGLSRLLVDQLEESATELRVLPWHRVDLARSSLDIPVRRSPNDAETGRLLGLLAVEKIVLGTCSCTPPPDSRCEARVRVADWQRGSTAEWVERFPPEQTSSAALRLGEKLRAHLGIKLRPTQRAALSARIPSQPELLRLYAEGTLALARHDLKTALEYLDAAVAADPLYYDAQRARTLVLQRLGLFTRAAEAARAMRRAADPLSTSVRAEADARVVWLGAPLEQALAAFQALAAKTPDDVDLALELGVRLPPQAALVLVKRLHELPSLSARDLRLDLLEVGMQIRLRPDAATMQQLESLEARARGLGALRELSAILELRYRLHLVRGEKDEALRALEEAVAVTRDVGDLARTAELMSSEAEDYLLVDSQRSVALRVEASSTLRGLSDRMRLHKLLLGQAFDEFRRGSVPVARERWAEAKHELDAVGEPVTPYTWLAAAWMELFAGNASAARERYGRARQTGPRNLWVTTSDLFSFLSTYDDPTLFEEQYLSVLELALLQVEDRASEARALALALKHRGEEANQPRNVAYAERALCNLECEDGEGRISDRCLELLEAFPADKSQCFLEIGQPAAAVRTAEPALQKEPSDPLLRASLEAAEALLGRTGGLAELEALSTSLRERGSVARALRVEYLLGRVEVGLHSPGGARRLRAVAKAGRAGGFVRLARRAEEAADTRPRREQAPPHP